MTGITMKWFTWFAQVYTPVINPGSQPVGAQDGCSTAFDDAGNSLLCAEDLLVQTNGYTNRLPLGGIASTWRLLLSLRKPLQ